MPPGENESLNFGRRATTGSQSPPKLVDKPEENATLSSAFCPLLLVKNQIAHFLGNLGKVAELAEKFFNEPVSA
jgi:hypothetical protein